MKKRLSVRVEGRVQGVFFRDTTKRTAKKLGLTGFVKNSDDGVEIIAEGDEKNLKELLKWCYKGPMLARVDAVKYKHLKFKDEFDLFEIRY